MNDITGFTFYKSYYESLLDLEEQDRQEMLLTIFEYVFEDKEPDFKGFKKTIWTLIKPNLTTSKNKSNKTKLKPNENQNETKTKPKKRSDLIDKEKEKDKELDIDNKKKLLKEKIIPKEIEDYNWLEEEQS